MTAEAMPLPTDLAIVDDLPAADEANILAGLKAHNNVMLGPTDRRNLAIPLRNEAGEVDGGLVGYTGRGWLCVEMLYVPERWRGQGLAGRLLQMAEDEARARGCVGAYIDTANPQARRAYERQGYQTFGMLENFIGDFHITWMKKQI